MKRVILTLCATVAAISLSAQPHPYQDPSLSHLERAKDLVSRMTLEEKIAQMQNGAPGIDRLGVAQYDWWSEALHGIARAGLATVFPQTIGMAASFDDKLVEEVFTATSDEARAKHAEFVRNGSRKRYQGLTVWTPNINIFRDPRWGRGQETYGEDPYLTTYMGLAVVRGLQGEQKNGFDKLHACAKHYAVHSGPEWNRHSFDAKNILQRDLQETYLPAFEALVKAGVKEVMGAYNRFEGEPCNGSRYLLDTVLRQQWGYKGIVVSDCGAIRDFFAKGHHETHPDAASASADAVKAGCDLECGSSYAALGEAVKRGLITEEEIDRSVIRLMEARFSLGLFEKEDPFNIPYSVVDCKEHRELAKKMAIESFVLLQNRGRLLPLNRSEKVAVVGPNADNEEMQWGNYNGTPSYVITLKEGLEALLPKGNVIYEPLCDYTDVKTFRSLLDYCAIDGKKGYKASFWNNLDFEGEPAATIQVDRPINFDTNGNTVVAPGVNLTSFTGRYETRFSPDKSGEAAFRFTSNETVRVYIDGKLVVDKANVKTESVGYEFAYTAGETYDVVVEFAGYRRRHDPYMKLDLVERVPQDIPAFLEKIKDVDVVIFASGLWARLEGEEMSVSAEGFRGGDRESIELPKIQRETIEALHEAGKKVVLVNFSGSAIALEPEAVHCDAILQAWYPGQEGGSALADVIYGKAVPQGKLPVTFYRNTEQLPDFEDYNMKGHTYRYFEGEPLFRFGHGLSYTDFFYGYLKADRTTLRKGQSIFVTVPVGNVGSCKGTEVVQLYLSRPADTEGPKQALRGYRRVTLDKGQTDFVIFELKYEDFAWFNPATNRMEPQKGKYIIRVGGSSYMESQRKLHVILK